MSVLFVEAFSKHLMRRTSLCIFILLLINCCKSKVDKDILAISDIRFPLIMNFKSSDSLTNLALQMALDELKEKKEPIDSMFVTACDYDSMHNVIIFRIEHFDSFLLERKLKLQDSPYGQVPPSGNWSGHDRTMIYRLDDMVLNDIPDQ